MAASDPAGQVDLHEPEPSGTGRRIKRDRDRHGRREDRYRTKRTVDPGYTVGAAKTVPMTGDEYTRAVRAWAVLIAAWWTEHPPDQDEETTT